MPFTVMLERLLLLTSRVLPAKVNAVGKTGDAFQLPLVPN